MAPRNCRRQQLSTYVDDEMYERLRQHAFEQRRSMADAMRIILDEFFGIAPAKTNGQSAKAFKLGERLTFEAWPPPPICRACGSDDITRQDVELRCNACGLTLILFSYEDRAPWAEVVMTSKAS